jgi:hypothetical protein
MSPNQNNTVSIERLKELESITIPVLLHRPEVWRTLDVDYHPPRVERLYMDHANGDRIYLHVKHATDSPCLLHKHNWPSVIKQVIGSDEMGITYSEDEINSSKAHTLPTLARFIIVEGSYYEMTQTDALHYVRPITPISYSIMLTNGRFYEHVFRQEAVTRKLSELSDDRKMEILDIFKSKMA